MFSIPENDENKDNVNNDDDAVEDVPFDDNCTSEERINDDTGRRDQRIIKLCIFCDKNRRQFKCRKQKIISTKNYRCFDNISRHAIMWDDFELQNKIVLAEQENGEINFHKICKVDYNYKIKKASKPAGGEWHRIRDIYKNAFKVVIHFIKSHVMKNRSACTLQFIEKLFKEALIDQCEGEEGINQNLYTRHLSIKIKHYFRKKIKYQKRGRSVLIFPAGAFQIDINTLEDLEIIHKAALIIRRAIINCEKTKLSKPITIEKVLKGKGDDR